jgi:hypothetical protein
MPFKLSGPQSRSGRHGEVKILYPTGTRTPTPWSSSPWTIAIPTTLPWLITVCYSIKMDRRGIGCEGMDWINLAQVSDCK